VIRSALAAPSERAQQSGRPAHAPAQTGALRAGRPGLTVEVAQGLEDFIDADRLSAAGRATQRGRGLNRAGVGRPGGEDRALFVDRQIRVGNDVARMFESLRRMEQVVEIEGARSFS
jgi:hypothetical protein